MMLNRHRVFALLRLAEYTAEVVLCSHRAPWKPGAHAQDISPSHGIKEHVPALRQ